MRCVGDYSHNLGRAVDELGDTFLTYHNHSARHNRVAATLARAARQALHKTVKEDEMAHETFSPGARPDVAIRLTHRRWTLLEVKCVCPISSVEARTGLEGTFAALGNTEAGYRRSIIGGDAVAGRAATPAKYAGAIGLGNSVVPCVFETFGGAGDDVLCLLQSWNSSARAKVPPGEEPPWCARNYLPYWSQLLSKEAQRGAAAEILARVSDEVAACESMRARGVAAA